MSRDPEERPSNLLDRLVDLAARGLDAAGFNGTRLRWRWNRRRSRVGEARARGGMLWRSARATHKMCPACRALVDRGARTCDSCGHDLAGVRAPGFGRLLANLFPGATTASSLVLLANGFWFLLTMLAWMRTDETGGFGLFASFGGKLLLGFGSGYNPLTLSGEWWRIVTPIFLHGGIVHFFFNSWVLLQLGPLVEEEFGTERFWCIYLASGIAGSVASQFVRPFLPFVEPYVNTVGASGAIFGLMGLLLVHGWRRGGVAGEHLRRGMTRYLLYMAVFSLLVPGIDHLNHVGGLLCGALAGLLVRSGGFRSRPAALVWEVAAVSGVLLVLLCFYKVAVTVSFA